jgi:type II restriction enzyme
LLVIAKKSEDYFQAYVLSSDNEIDEFLDTLNLSSTHVNGIVPKHAGFPTERGLKD